MICRKAVGWLVAQAYVLAGRRCARCRRIRRQNEKVSVLLHGPSPAYLAALFTRLDRLVGLERLEVSFDDGRRVLKDCVPVLERFSVKSVWFISPGEILRGYNWAERIKGHAALRFSELAHLSAAEREAVLQAAGLDAPGEDLLTPDDVRTLARHPLVTFGNHTWSHLSCACRPVAEVLDEVDRAGKRIADWTGYSPMAFSYPFGHDTPEVEAALRARGFTTYGSARNMAYECYTLAEDIGRILGAWPHVRRMPV